MPKTKKQKKMLTRSDILKVLDLWETATTTEIAEAIKRPRQTVTYIAHEIRKAGYKLPRKRVGGQLQLMIREVLQSQELI